MIRLPDRVAARIRLDGENAYPDECCGVIIGRFGADGTHAVEDALPVDNAREPGRRRRRFRIEADDVMRAELEAGRRGLDVLGFYHSHPDHPAEPSEYDREHALPGYVYVIVAVDNGGAGEVKSWSLSPDRTAFAPEPAAGSAR